MKHLIIYATLSGNTEEVAEIVFERIVEERGNDEVVLGYIDPFVPTEFDVIDTHNIDAEEVDVIDYMANDADVVYFGTYTWDLGAIPTEVQEFLENYYDEIKVNDVRLFGTGDTQFGGDEFFCGALDAIKSSFFFEKNGGNPLRIEQSPRGGQEGKVITWVDEQLKDF